MEDRVVVVVVVVVVVKPVAVGAPWRPRKTGREVMMAPILVRMHLQLLQRKLSGIAPNVSANRVMCA